MAVGKKQKFAPSSTHNLVKSLKSFIQKTVNREILEMLIQCYGNIVARYIMDASKTKILELKEKVVPSINKRLLTH